MAVEGGRWCIIFFISCVMANVKWSGKFRSANKEDWHGAFKTT